jgi:hypothetical protein
MSAAANAAGWLYASGMLQRLKTLKKQKPKLKKVTYKRRRG